MNKFLLVIVLTLISIGGAAAQEEENAQPVMSGTEQPELQDANDAGKCYVFAKYIVKTVTGEAVGEDIDVFRRAQADAEAPCQTSGKPYLSIKNPDANYFIGLSGAHLFIDSGTSVESRGLEIFSLTTRKSIFTTEYIEDAKLGQNRFLVFNLPSEQKGNPRTCKDAAKWKREGLGVGWAQSRRLDLQTLKATPIGALRCYAVQ